MSTFNMNKTQNESTKNQGVKNQLLNSLFQDRKLTLFEAYYLKFKISNEKEYPISEFYTDVALAYDIPDVSEVQKIINSSIFNSTPPLSVHLQLRDYMLDKERRY